MTPCQESPSGRWFNWAWLALWGLFLLVVAVDRLYGWVCGPETEDDLG